MKTIIPLLFILTISASAKDIDISFGCYDCKENKKEETKYQKPINKEKTTILKDIKISGTATVQTEKID